MRKNKGRFFILLSFFAWGQIAFSQEPLSERVAEKEVSFLVHKIADSLTYYYVNEAEGIKIGNYLLGELDKGSYSKNLTPEELAIQFTQDLRELNCDLLLFVNFHKQEIDKHQEAEPK
ncbi:MAG: hypothetical protein AAF696_26580, partial [Bacteroidota bacterium]